MCNSLFRSLVQVSPPVLVLVFPDINIQQRERFPEHLQDLVHEPFTARNFFYILRVSSLVKALVNPHQIGVNGRTHQIGVFIQFLAPN